MDPFGALYWDKLIKNNTTEDLWDYDISPEFIFNQDE